MVRRYQVVWYCRELYTLTQNCYFCPQIFFGHVSCSHSLRPTCISQGNYIPAQERWNREPPMVCPSCTNLTFNSCWWWEGTQLYDIVESFIFWRKIIVFPSIFPCIMMPFAKNHLYLTWDLHSSTSKDEIESPLWYVHRAQMSHLIHADGGKVLSCMIMLSILLQNNHFPLNVCHVSYSHSLRPICIPHGNYIRAQVKLKWRALYNMSKDAQKIVIFKVSQNLWSW